MILGISIAVIYRLITIYGGLYLAGRPERLRWEKPWAAGLLGLLAAGAAAFRLWHLSAAKFSVEEMVITGIYMGVLLMVFFKGPLWHMAVQNFIYWVNVLILEYCILCAASYYAGLRIRFYNMHIYSDAFSWSRMHGILYIAVAAVLIFLVCLTWKRGMAGSSRTYGLLSVLLSFYGDIRKRERLVEMNYHTLSSQYGALHEMYREKRRQFHDVRQHYIILDGYIRSGEVEAAQKYVDALLEDTQKNGMKAYTGIQVIDFILNYKLSGIEEKAIETQMIFDVSFAPVKDIDLCIILGNLLDNALEAAGEAPRGQGWIWLSIKTKGNIFILEIKNSCCETRKKKGGRYETTKPDKTEHGLGLDNVKKIVDAYDGLLEIQSSGREFYVAVTLFYKE